MINRNVKVTIDDKGSKRYVNIAKNSFVIGRSLEVDVSVPFDYISRQQVHVTIIEGAVWVEDLGSSNGTWIEGRRLTPKVKELLVPGQVLILGQKATTEILIEIEAQTISRDIRNLTSEIRVAEREGTREFKREISAPVSREFSKPKIEAKEIFARGSEAIEDVKEAIVQKIEPKLEVKEAIVQKIEVKDVAKEVFVQKAEPREIVQEPLVQRETPKEIARESFREVRYRSQAVGQSEMPLKKVANGSEVYPDAKKKLVIVDPVIENRVAEKINNVEKSVFDQIKHLMSIEAQEIRVVATEEAQQIRHQANIEALNMVQKAKAEAAAKLKEAEILTDQKLQTLNQIEAEKRKVVEALTTSHLELTSELEVLKQSKGEHQEFLLQLKNDIEIEQEAIQDERAKISEERFQLAEEKRRIEEEFNELEREESSVKARIEADLLEAQNKAAHIHDEAAKALDARDTLSAELHTLEQQRDQVLANISNCETESYSLVEKITGLKQELSVAAEHLEQIYKNQDETNRDIENSKQSLLNFERMLDERDKATQSALENAKVESEQIIQRANEKAESIVFQSEIDLKNLLARQDQLMAELKRIEEEMGLKIAEAEKNAAQIVIDGRKDSEEIINSARKETSVIMEEAEKYAEKKKADAEKILFNARKESVSIKEEAEKYAEKKKSESEGLLEKARQQSASIKVEAATHLEKTKLEAEKVLEEAKVYEDEKKKEADLILSQLKSEVVTRKKESMQALGVAEDKKKKIETEISQLEAQKQKRLEENNEQIKNLKAVAQREAHELKVKLETSVHQEIKKLKADGEASLVENQNKYHGLISKLEAEYKEAKSKQEAEFKEAKLKQETYLLEYRQVEMAQIKKLTKKAEEDFKNTKTEKARTVANNVYALIASEMYKARNKVMDENFIETFSKELKSMVSDIMLDKLDPDSTKLQSLLKTSEDARGKEKQFWRRLGYMGAGVVFLFLLVTAFPSIITGPKNMIVAAFTEKGPSQADAYVQNKFEEAKVRLTYAPPTTPEYKTEYVDNILFTTDYESKKQNEAFHDKWILELNDYFINNLDVKDTTIIKFVSLESSLLRDLAKLKSQVDPANPEPKIEEMRKREKEFKEKLGVIFDDHGKVSQYYAFSIKFWNDFHHPRIPSTQAE